MLKLLIVAFTVLTLSDANKETLQTFKEGNKLLAAGIHKQVAKLKNHENFLVCPVSAEIALSLAQNGAKGKTRQEIRKALHLPNSTAEINALFKTLLTDLKTNEEYTFHIANKLYVKETCRIKDQFARIAKEIYQSSTQNVDFSQTHAAAKTINDWVSKQTQDKIQNLVEADTLSKDTVAVLVNALYLQADWRKSFKKTLTRKRDFYSSEEKLIQVDTMKKIEYFGYQESDKLDAKFLQMQFRGGRNASMVIVLPNKRDGLKKLENKVEEIYDSNFNWELVEVALPKFKIETSIDFKKVLKKLGVKRAFSRADFSAMAGVRGEIYISDILQKTFIDVNENGVEAAAATQVNYHPKSLMEFTGEKKTFIADHPFLFYILIDNIVIFTGRVVSP